MNKPRYLRTLRALAECYHAFGRYSGAHVRSLGYTPAQFDVVATLGNTAGMTFKELGTQTLITKGTLTGVVDRLEARGVVRRAAAPTDRRSTLVVLTDAGEAEFRRVFSAHTEFLGHAFSVLSAEDMQLFEALSGRLRAGFQADPAARKGGTGAGGD